MAKKTTFEFSTNSGKRQYSLWLDVDDYNNRYTIFGNKIIVCGKDTKINKNSHKDWYKAFVIDESNPYNTIIEFKKGAICFQVDTLDNWVNDRRLIMIGGSRI